MILVICNLNGLAKWNKHLQVEPTSYEAQIRKLGKATADFGARSIMSIGGDGDKWSVRGAKFYNLKTSTVA